MKWKEVFKFLSGAFFVTAGASWYFYWLNVAVPFPFFGFTTLPPEFLAIRGCVHAVLFLITFYFGFIKKAQLGHTPSTKDELIGVLQKKNIGLTTVVVVCDAISANAKFNMWFLDVVKKRATEQEAMEQLDQAERLEMQCSAIIEKFEQDGDLSKFKESLSGYVEQLRALTEWRPKLG